MLNRLRRILSNAGSHAASDNINKDIEKYREFDSYQPDIVTYEAVTIHVDKVLPSEPPAGVTYEFCASGYFTKNRDNKFCIIPTEWRNVDNYCHWTFSELPLLCLALESDSEYIVIPDRLLNAKLPFHRRWWEILRKRYPDKKLVPLSRCNNKVNGIMPVNHDTSSSKKLIVNCEYRHYHHGRATPYCIDILGRMKNEFKVNDKLKIPGFYINRKNRRLKNESEVQKLIVDFGLDIITLEDFTLDEQIQLFSAAEIIIGFHGAGLANLIYSSPDLSVLEIVDADSVYPSYKDGLVIPGVKAPRTYYHVLSCMKNIDYHCIESEDYLLNIEHLRQKLMEIIPL
jgi:hypothetical protein